MPDERGVAYWETGADGSEYAVLRASGLGAECEASLVRSLVGQPREAPPAFMLRAFDAGRAGEAAVLAGLDEKYGWKAVDEDTLALFGKIGADGQIETEFLVGKHRVRCHPDGIAVKMDRGGGDDKVGSFAVVEAKLLSRGMYEKWCKVGLDVLSVYRWQVAIEMLTTGLPCVYVVGVKDDDGVLVPGEVYMRKYDEPPVPKAEIVKKVLRVVRAAREHEAGGEMMPCVEGGQYPCGYYTLGDTACGTAGERKREAGDGLDEETRDKINHWSQFFLTGQTIRDSGARKMELAKEKLLELVGESVTVGQYDITYRKGSVGAVSWKAVAEEIARDFGMDDTDWAEIQDEFRGKPGSPSLSVKLKENDADTKQ